jgi:hypothetical protein
MPHVIELDLKLADFRLRPGVTPNHHWLVRDFFGRTLLVKQLRLVRPGFNVPRFKVPAELLPVLDQMVDLLDLRAWPEPATEFGRAAASVMLLRMCRYLSRGAALPSWQDGFGIEQEAFKPRPLAG